MSSYVRKPKYAIAKCQADGCKWIRIYFERHQPATPPNRHWTPELRAEMALLAHQRAAHRVKVLINGR